MPRFFNDFRSLWQLAGILPIPDQIEIDAQFHNSHSKRSIWAVGGINNNNGQFKENIRVISQHPHSYRDDSIREDYYGSNNEKKTWRTDRRNVHSKKIIERTLILINSNERGNQSSGKQENIVEQVACIVREKKQHPIRMVACETKKYKIMGDSNGTSHVSSEMEIMWDRVTHPHILAPTRYPSENVCVCHWQCMPCCSQSIVVFCAWFGIYPLLTVDALHIHLLSLLFIDSIGQKTHMVVCRITCNVRCSMRYGTRCDKWKLLHILHFLFCLLNRSRSTRFWIRCGNGQKKDESCVARSGYAQIGNIMFDIWLLVHICESEELNCKNRQIVGYPLSMSHLISTTVRKFAQTN